MSVKRQPFGIMRAVVFALMMREMKTRFGVYRLGYLWALLEPGIHIAVFAIIFGFIAQRTMPGINFIVFLTTGIIPWLMFNSMLSRGMSAVSANQGLFSYRQVKPMDSILARMILEGIIYSSIYLFILLIFIWSGVDISIEDPLKVIAAFLLLFLFSYGLSTIMCIVVTQAPEVKKLVPIFLRPLYFMSGIFFSIESIPQEYRAYLMWNPVMQTNELSRDAFFTAYQTPEGSWSYLALCAAVALIFGLALYRQNREKLVTT